MLSFVMSQWLVGRPVRALSEKARRVGRGDFSSHVTLRQRDELAELAREMNAMSDRLVATMEQLRHADRLATVGSSRRASPTSWARRSTWSRRAPG